MSTLKMLISWNLFIEFSFYALDTVTQAVSRVCQNKKKEPSSCDTVGAVCSLLSSGEEARETRGFVCQHPTAVPCLGWGAWEENAYFTLSCPPFPRTFWKRTVCPLGLITRGLSGRSLQTQQSEKYAQSYLVQNLGTSQISVLMQKRHLLLAFSQGLGQTFSFYLLTPLLRSQVPLQAFITTKRDTWVRTKRQKYHSK